MNKLIKKWSLPWIVARLPTQAQAQAKGQGMSTQATWDTRKRRTQDMKLMQRCQRDQQQQQQLQKKEGQQQDKGETKR